MVELEQMEDGRIIGKYRTAVESTPGAAGTKLVHSRYVRKTCNFGNLSGIVYVSSLVLSLMYPLKVLLY